MLRWASILLIGVLGGCGGGSGGGNEGAAPTYSIAGVVTRAGGAPVAGVTMSLTGAAMATTTTNANGAYTFGSLANGTYTVTPTLAGLDFVPGSQAVVVNAANVAGVDFAALALAKLASGIEFLPATFSSSDQLRVSLIVNATDAFTTDSSDQPLKKISLANSAVTALAPKIGTPESVVLHGQYVYWVDGGKLNQTALDGSATNVLATGERDAGTVVTAEIVVDDTDVYWVNTDSNANLWIIRRVPLSGAAASTLVSVDRAIVALAADADTIYWEEDSVEPWTAGCQCGSVIKAIPKAGGQISLIVDGSLNGGLPAPPPGQTPGSWQPTGGIAVDAANVYFGVAGQPSYRIDAVAIAGGAITTLATVDSGAGLARNAVRDISVDASNAYWIDSDAGELDKVAIAGGNVTTLASGISVPSLNDVPALAIGATDAFWTERGSYAGCCLQIGGGRIRTVALAGGAAATVLGNLDDPGAIAVDGQTLAWTEIWRVAKASTAGVAPTTLASGISSDLARIAADQNNLYILDGDLVKWLPLGGGTVEKLASAHAGKIHDLAAQNQDIATDGTSVYWTFEAGASGPQLQKVAVSGGPVTVLAPANLVGPPPQDCYWRIALDTQNVYWSGPSDQFPIGCTVNRVAKTGGAVTTPVDFAYLRDFAVDDSNVYFSEFSTNDPSIRRVPVGGGALAKVVGNAPAWVLTQDATTLYWLDVGVSGGIGFAEKSQTNGVATPPVFGPLASDPLLAADAITVTADALYWTESVSGDIYVVQ